MKQDPERPPVPDAWQIAKGFGIYLLLAGGMLLSVRMEFGLGVMVFLVSILITPFIGLIFIFVRDFRGLGLGMLIGFVLGLLVLISICGGPGNRWG